MEQLINFETCILAREKGFYEKSSDLHADELFYHHTGEVYNHFFSQGDRTALAPTQSQLQCWLREKHNIQVYAYSHTIKGDKWGDYVVYLNNTALNDARDEEFQRYEEALEVGLYEALKTI